MIHKQQIILQIMLGSTDEGCSSLIRLYIYYGDKLPSVVIDRKNMLCTGHNNIYRTKIQVYKIQQINKGVDKYNTSHCSTDKVS